jgi:predicted metal-dependent enzyme (double-stranded beta helix superfamily)
MIIIFSEYTSAGKEVGVRATEELITVRECARSFVELDAPLQGGPKFQGFVEAATPVFRRLLQRPDLLTMGFVTGTHRVPTRLLYCDGQLSIVAGQEPPRLPVAVHDHSMWEMLGLYRGTLDHTLYGRADDMTRPGYAELEVIDHRVMEPGDVICVPPPPHDIHGFTALRDNTWLVAILPGWYPNVRRYFEPERNIYYLQSQTPV